MKNKKPIVFEQYIKGKWIKVKDSSRLIKGYKIRVYEIKRPSNKP